MVATPDEPRLLRIRNAQQATGPLKKYGTLVRRPDLLYLPPQTFHHYTPLAFTSVIRVVCGSRPRCHSSSSEY